MFYVVFGMVPRKGVEPILSKEKQILSLPRLPFRHLGDDAGLVDCNPTM